jgi:predicted ATP-grasp superfamily ATP-dependent carboligase
MYIVREVFIAKPGHAGELAQMMKKEMASWKGFKGYVLLDTVTDYNKIVCEYELDSLTTFEKMMTDYKKDQAKVKSKKPPKYTELYQRGKREIYRVVE